MAATAIAVIDKSRTERREEEKKRRGREEREGKDREWERREERHRVPTFLFLRPLDIKTSCWRMPPKLREGLPHSAQHFWKYPHRHTQRRVS